jgi:solute carrier family 35 (UDP-galactose transporter), member B1
LVLFILDIVLKTFGQIFTFKIITDYGSLPLSMVGGFRKFISIILSVIIFGHHLKWYQTVAIGIITLAVVVEVTAKKEKKRKSSKSHSN